MEYLISIAALAVSLWTYFVTSHGTKQAERSANTAEKDLIYSSLNAKAELFVSLRTAYLDIHKNFPCERGYDASKYELIFRAYWVNAYNEWYVTKKICPSYKLWEEFYEDAIKGALEQTCFEKSLNNMIEDGFAFGTDQLKSEFLQEIGYNSVQK